MTYSTLDWRVDDGLLWLTLNRPDKLNAFDVVMMRELQDAFARANEDDSVRVVVVTGAGRAFCAGMDLSVGGNVFGLDENQRPTLADVQHRFDDPAIRDGVRDSGGKVSLAILACRKPVIAAINGAAVGIGATMTLAMDFRLASENARIGFVFEKIGIVPEACSSWFLPRLVGLQRALEWVYTGDILTPEQALAGGLLRSIHPGESLLAEAEAFARRIVTDRSAVSIALARQMLHRNSVASDPLDAHRIESLAMFYASIGDGKEGVASFLEKRRPQFQGRASSMPAFYDEWLGCEADEA